MRFHESLLSLFRDCKNDERGNMLIVFALTCTVLIGAAGAAIDYGRAVSAKQRLVAAADATALGAARAALTAYTSSEAGTEDASQAAALTAAQAQAQALWSLSTSSILDAKSLAYSLAVTRQGNVWQASVTFSADVPTTLAGVFGFSKLPVGDTIVAQTAAPGQGYLDLYLLVDSSQSMGLAATTAGQNQMLAYSGCQFGCHVPGQDGNYTYMRANGIPMRIDVIRNAISTLLDDASSSAAGSVRAGLWMFDKSVTMLSDLTTDLATVKTTATAIDLPTVEDGTQTDDAVAQLTGIIPNSGDGSTQAESKKFLFLVTDGTQDGIYSSWAVPSALNTTGNGWQVSSMTGAACDAVKAKGVTVAVIYTTYVPFPGQWQYDDLIAPGADKIPSNMQACASPGFYIEASDDVAITAAMNKLLAKAIAATTAVRLTK